MANTQTMTLMESAAECCRSHRCEEAIAHLEAAAQLEPANSATHYHLGLCYSGGCRQHSWVDVQVAHVHLGKALSLLGAAAEPSERARILGALGNTYAASRHMPLKARLLAAIDCHEQAAAIYQSEGHLDDWAREEFNLGNAFSEIPEGGVPDRWQAAVRHYENALQVRTREKNPDVHAGILLNLGIAYRELPTGERAQNIKRSMLCYRGALQVWKPGSQRGRYAVVQNNLGNSFMSLAEADKAKAAHHIGRALRHYDRALALYSEEDMPGEYAMAQFNRGEALLRLGLASANPEVRLREACVCFEKAASHFQRVNRIELARKSRDWLGTVARYLDTLEKDQPRAA
jgi:tetratricopeptide (TPR) repeat protein